MRARTWRYRADVRRSGEYIAAAYAAQEKIRRAEPDADVACACGHEKGDHAGDLCLQCSCSEFRVTGPEVCSK